MKLMGMQTIAPELNLLNSTVYQGLAKLNNFFRTDLIEKQQVSLTLNGNSQFYRKLVELVGTGARAKATVLYAEETGILINGDPVLTMTIRFYNAKNNMIEMTAKTIASKIAVPRSADIITIAYKSGEPGIVAIL